jgi:hypothetical protein
MTEEEMMAAMGIPVQFDTTKLKKRGAAESMSLARVKSNRKARQYMNIKKKTTNDPNHMEE